jgi:hypothetical protein
VRKFAKIIRAGLVLAAAAFTLAAVGPAEAQQAGQQQDLVVYLIDHQFVSDAEMATIQGEIGEIFQAEANVTIRWIMDDSPRRRLASNELRFLILASDGTRWFHGPSNVIGLAPHDDTGVGRNSFVFYRQALWFRQQAVLRCREATRARSQAAATGVTPDPSIDALAPPECGDHLTSLTPLVVARAAAHEMVHILLNKLDHSEGGLMRKSFDITEWLAGEQVSFRLLPEEITALQQLLQPATTAPGR